MGGGGDAVWPMAIDLITVKKDTCSKSHVRWCYLQKLYGSKLLRVGLSLLE